MYIADLHIHSRYSRATSRECDPGHLDLWAGRKGVRLLGSGDFTHPAWRRELKDALLPAEDGLYRLKDDFVLKDGAAADGERPRFVVSGEISTIYKKNGKTRKVHNLILLPGLEEAEQLSRRLERIGNVHSDGRPILGLDSRDLLEITLETCPRAIFIPAHIWTPHFSLFGAFSGFDTIEECFEDLTGHVRALETGLSSDPPMNWRLSALDGYQLVSNSDAHSPAKLGREANLLDTELSYDGLYGAIQEGRGLLGTIEFFPEEGKYHMDGHRKCGQCLTPVQTREHGGKCPVCGGKITIGVLHRVEELADREEGYQKPDAKSFESLAPLPEVIAASTGKSASSVKVLRQYEAMLKALGPEFFILRQAPLEAVRSCAGPCIEEGIRRLRQGQVRRIPGYDGEYGKIDIIGKEEIQELCGQTSFFESIALPSGSLKKKPAQARQDKASDSQTRQEKAPRPDTEPGGQPEQDKKAGKQPGGEALENREQQAAITSESPAAAVIAGPGTGKTYTLIRHIAWLLQQKKARPSDITAVTFTNKSARELKERLAALLGKTRAEAVTACTFHSLCFTLVREARGDIVLADEQQQRETAAKILKALNLNMMPDAFLRQVSAMKNSGFQPDSGERGSVEKLCSEKRFVEKAGEAQTGGEKPAQTKDPRETRLSQAAEAYINQLKERELYDFDDLLLATLELGTSLGKNSRLLVDEFQDISPVQYRLIRQWSRDGKELFVIGDPDQAIYGFRGADSRCFDQFHKDYPKAAGVVLTKNYRSAPDILRCALPVINRNPGSRRILEPAAAKGEKVRLVKAESPLSQGIFAAGEINRMTGGMDMMDAQNFALKRERHRSFGDIALLYRTRRQARILETCLQKESIPYTVTGKEDFLSDRLVTGTIAFFRALLALGQAEEAGEDSRRREAEEALGEAGRRLFQTKPEETAAHLAKLFLPNLSAREAPESLLKKWREKAGLSGHKPLKRLEEMAVFYDAMAPFLDNLLLGEEQDMKRSACGNLYKSGAVSLMTIHAAKGLEFPVVFLCGLDEDALPIKGGDPEEERRLFYVGLTRAKEELILLSSGESSPFLRDVPASAVTKEEACKKKSRPSGEQLKFL